MHPPISADVVEITEPLFASADLRVIGFKGDNYYKACGQIVREYPAGGTSSCILPEHHTYHECEDIDGNKHIRGFEKVTYSQEVRSLFRNVMKRSGLDDTQVFNALNAIEMAGLQLSLNPEEQ